MIFSRIPGDFWRFLEIFGDFWRFLEILGDSWRFLEILLKFSHIITVPIVDLWRILEDSRRFLRTFKDS